MLSERSDALRPAELGKNQLNRSYSVKRRFAIGKKQAPSNGVSMAASLRQRQMNIISADIIPQSTYVSGDSMNPSLRQRRII